MHRGLPEGNTKLVLILFSALGPSDHWAGSSRIPSQSCLASSWASRLRLFHSHKIACTGIYMYAHDINECRYDLYNYRATNNWKLTLRIYANLLLPIPTLFC